MLTIKPLLHINTEQALEKAVKRVPHAIMLTGPTGVGKTAVANFLAAQLLNIDLGKLQDYPHLVQIVSEDGKAIGIEVVRQLEHSLSLRIPSQQSVTRVITISDAQLLTIEAQNALLKTLEEPPVGTVLLLTCPDEQSVLPTIRSRTQVICVQIPARANVETYLQDNGVASKDVAKIMALSGGLPGLALALADNDQDHPLVAAAVIARQLLQQSTFEKLCQVDKLAKDKPAGQNLTYILQQMAHAAILTGRGTQRWQKILAAAYQAEAALGQGTQPKLVLTNLMLNL